MLRNSSGVIINVRCLRIPRSGVKRRAFTTSTCSPLQASNLRHDQQSSPDGKPTQEQEVGAMSRLLAEMSERSLEEGGRGAQKAVKEAGFDEELKQRLLDRIAGAKFKADHQSAFARANVPSSAGKQSRDIASSTPWSGTESLEDATLRMLNEARKPLKVPSKPHGSAKIPSRVDTGRSKSGASTGKRLANARDRSSMYSYLKDETYSEKEREQFKKEMKEKFTPGARPMPVTLTGLQSLANERIEDAIARGLFKNLPRGEKIERDYNMSSPFLDTTEYFLNKMIKKQEIVPPWIEKQQELLATANKFRSRLRNDWKRYAARMIASRGGSLDSQIRQAEEHARAEAIVNPSKKKQEQINTVDSDGHMSQINLSGQMRSPTSDETQSTFEITVEESPPKAVEAQPTEEPTSQGSPEMQSDANPIDNPAVIDSNLTPFRDPSWEQTEYSYQKLAIDNLNSLARTYNLMAPNLARKPYYSLERELLSCYADVAPQLPAEILERSKTPKVKIEVIPHRKGSVLENLAGPSAKVYDDRRKPYGFKELWRDVFSRKEQRA